MIYFTPYNNKKVENLISSISEKASSRGPNLPVAAIQNMMNNKYGKESGSLPLEISKISPGQTPRNSFGLNPEQEVDMPRFVICTDGFYLIDYTIDGSTMDLEEYMNGRGKEFVTEFTEAYAEKLTTDLINSNKP